MDKEAENKKVYTYGGKSMIFATILAITLSLLMIGTDGASKRSLGAIGCATMITVYVALLVFSSYVITISDDSIVVKNVLNPFRSKRCFQVASVVKMHVRCSRITSITIFYSEDGIEKRYSITTNIRRGEIKRMERNHPDINIVAFC